jgi:hypothetical protein
MPAFKNMSTDFEEFTTQKSVRRIKLATAYVFDLLFKRLLHLSNRAIVSFINGLFIPSTPMTARLSIFPSKP